MREKQIEQLVLLEAGKHNVSLWINNSGALLDETGRLVRFGLGNDSKQTNERLKFPDLVGVLPITITPNMVGITIGVFLGVELKKSDWKYSGINREQAQLNAINLIQSKGGVAGFVNGVDSFRKLIGL